MIDFFGALMSTFFLLMSGLFLSKNFGLPQGVLFSLSAYACFLGLISSLTLIFLDRHREGCLRLLCGLNVFYCIITALVIIFFSDEVALFAVVYFLLEICVIFILVFFERKALSASD